MKASSISVLAMANVVSIACADPNPSYDPHWTVGDTWMVRFTVKVSREPAEAGPPPAHTLADDVYTYQVVSEGMENGRNIVRIRADLSEPASHWLLTFDRDQISLLRVEEIVNSVPKGGVPNPFVDDACMFDLHEYFARIIHDFPKIPPTNTDETRDLSSPNGTPFTQAIAFSPGEVTADLLRTDPTTSLEHRTTFVWQSGAKWWSSATTTLGGEVQVSGVLEPAPRGTKAPHLKGKGTTTAPAATQLDRTRKAEKETEPSPRPNGEVKEP